MRRRRPGAMREGIRRGGAPGSSTARIQPDRARHPPTWKVGRRQVPVPIFLYLTTSKLQALLQLSGSVRRPCASPWKMGRRRGPMSVDRAAAANVRTRCGPKAEVCCTLCGDRLTRPDGREPGPAQSSSARYSRPHP